MARYMYIVSLRHPALYDYLLQRFSDEPVAVHEKCGGPVHKRISRSALQFKGTGWYITDYARKDQGKDQPRAEGTAEGQDKAKEGGEKNGVMSVCW